MNISDLMEAMAAAGAPMEAILLAVRAVEAKDAEIEARRAGDRERKRRQRAGGQDNAVTVTGQSRDTDGTVTDEPPFPSPPNENNLTPPAHTPAREPRARPDTRLPEHWMPEPLIVGSATDQIIAAWSPGRLERELSKFRDHYRAAPGAKGLARDWQAKWRTWLTNADNFGGETNGRRSGNRGFEQSASGYGRTVDAALDWINGA